jgi:hypothetical protein
MIVRASSPSDSSLPRPLLAGWSLALFRFGIVSFDVGNELVVQNGWYLSAFSRNCLMLKYGLSLAQLAYR